jgi:hypothetical protein
MLKTLSSRNFNLCCCWQVNSVMHFTKFSGIVWNRIILDKKIIKLTFRLSSFRLTKSSRIDFAQGVVGAKISRGTAFRPHLVLFCLKISDVDLQAERGPRRCVSGTLLHSTMWQRKTLSWKFRTRSPESPLIFESAPWILRILAWPPRISGSQFQVVLAMIFATCHPSPAG